MTKFAVVALLAVALGMVHPVPAEGRCHACENSDHPGYQNCIPGDWGSDCHTFTAPCEPDFAASTEGADGEGDEICVWCNTFGDPCGSLAAHLPLTAAGTIVANSAALVEDLAGALVSACTGYVAEPAGTAGYGVAQLVL
jgi:hypothetical protein